MYQEDQNIVRQFLEGCIYLNSNNITMKSRIFLKGIEMEALIIKHLVKASEEGLYSQMDVDGQKLSSDTVQKRRLNIIIFSY